jgi:hypothetical protein
LGLLSIPCYIGFSLYRIPVYFGLCLDRFTFLFFKVGENGAGKTTLLKILQGDLSPVSGICHLHRNLPLGLNLNFGLLSIPCYIGFSLYRIPVYFGLCLDDDFLKSRMTNGCLTLLN